MSISSITHNFEWKKHEMISFEKNNDQYYHIIMIFSLFIVFYEENKNINGDHDIHEYT